MSDFTAKESRRKKQSLVSQVANNEPIKGQESIETLEDGKYMPDSPKTKEKAEKSVTEHKEEQTAPLAEPKTAEEPKKMGRPPENRETKKRVSLAIMPSVYDNIGKIAYVDRTSISEIASQLFEQYIAENMDKIKEYDSLKK